MSFIRILPNNGYDLFKHLQGVLNVYGDGEDSKITDIADLIEDHHFDFMTFVSIQDHKLDVAILCDRYSANFYCTECHIEYCSHAIKRALKNKIISILCNVISIGDIKDKKFYDEVTDLYLSTNQDFKNDIPKLSKLLLNYSGSDKMAKVVASVLNEKISEDHHANLHMVYRQYDDYYFIVEHTECETSVKNANLMASLISKNYHINKCFYNICYLIKTDKSKKILSCCFRDLFNVLGSIYLTRGIINSTYKIIPIASFYYLNKDLYKYKVKSINNSQYLLITIKKDLLDGYPNDQIILKLLHKDDIGIYTPLNPYLSEQIDTIKDDLVQDGKICCSLEKHFAFQDIGKDESKIVYEQFKSENL
ncbi:hypothetical protein nvc2_022 [Namao virus]|nr:hypothetical protein nvc2_022 [Namao virus]